MGLDLTLLPFNFEASTWGFSHEAIQVRRENICHEQIMKLQQLPVPPQFSTYFSRLPNGERGYGDTQETPYGERLMTTTMEQLATLGLSGPAGAFISASPPNQRVALFWH